MTLAAHVCVYVYGSNDLARSAYDVDLDQRVPIGSAEVVRDMQRFLDFVAEERSEHSLPMPRIHVVPVLARPAWGGRQMTEAVLLNNAVARHPHVTSMVFMPWYDRFKHVAERSIGGRVDGKHLHPQLYPLLLDSIKREVASHSDTWF